MIWFMGVDPGDGGGARGSPGLKGGGESIVYNCAPPSPPTKIDAPDLLVCRL